MNTILEPNNRAKKYHWIEIVSLNHVIGLFFCFNDTSTFVGYLILIYIIVYKSLLLCLVWFDFFV